MELRWAHLGRGFVPEIHPGGRFCGFHADGPGGELALELVVGALMHHVRRCGALVEF